MSITDDSKDSKINPSCSMQPACIKATYNDYFSISHFTDSLTSLSKEIQYILKQKSLATQNLVGIIFIVKIPVLKMN